MDGLSDSVPLAYPDAKTVLGSYNKFERLVMILIREADPIGLQSMENKPKYLIATRKFHLTIGSAWKENPPESWHIVNTSIPL